MNGSGPLLPRAYAVLFPATALAFGVEKAGRPPSQLLQNPLTQKKCSLPQAPLATLSEAEANYQSSSLCYQQLKPLAAELCSDFLHRHTLEPQHSEMHLKAVANILWNMP